MYLVLYRKLIPLTLGAYVPGSILLIHLRNIKFTTGLLRSKEALESKTIEQNLAL